MPKIQDGAHKPIGRKRCNWYAKKHAVFAQQAFEPPENGRINLMD
jgi:hypothetical protein